MTQDNDLRRSSLKRINVTKNQSFEARSSLLQIQQCLSVPLNLRTFLEVQKLMHSSSVKPTAQQTAACWN